MYAASGGDVIRSKLDRNAVVSASISRSEWSRISGRVAPPTNPRSTTTSAGARAGNFSLTKLQARIGSFSTRGTKNPKLDSGAPTALLGKTRLTVAHDA